MWQLLAGLLVGGTAGVLRRSLPNHNRVKLEEYRIFIEDTSRYSDRRQTVTNIYVGVNTILLTAIALLLANGDAGSATGPPYPSVPCVLVLVSAAGVAASSVWLFLVHRYERIIAARLRELKNIEQDLAGSHQMYRRMDEAFCGKVPSFSKPEKVLPIVFIVLHCLLFLSFSRLLLVALS